MVAGDARDQAGLLAVRSHPEQALATIGAANETLTPVQRRTRLVNLRHFLDAATPDQADLVRPLLDALEHPATQIEQIDLDAGQEADTDRRP